MIGVWGFSGDLTSLSADNQARVAEHVRFYKEWRRFIADSVAHMLTPPRGIHDQTGWSVVQLCHAGDRRSLVFAYRLQDERGRDVYRLTGLDADTVYRVDVFPNRGEVDSSQRSGAELMGDGLEIELRVPGTGRVYVVTPE